MTRGGNEATGGGSEYPSLSADGRYVGFESAATNLVSGDDNDLTDAFLQQATGVPTYLTVRAYPTVLSRYGATTKVFGYLRGGSSSGPALADETVYLQKSSNGTSGWSDVASRKTSDSGFVVFPRSSCTGRPTTGCSIARTPRRGGSSSAVRVTPRAYVRTPIAPKTMRRSRYYTVYGYLKPRHKAGTYPVRIYKWKKTSSGRWKSYGYVNAKAYNYSSYTKYLRKIKLTSRGKWRLRAYARADSAHAAAWSSGYDYVTVK